MYNNEHALKSYEAIKLSRKAYFNGNIDLAMEYFNIVNRERIEDLKEVHKSIEELLKEKYKNL